MELLVVVIVVLELQCCRIRGRGLYMTRDYIILLKTRMRCVGNCSIGFVEFCLFSLLIKMFLICFVLEFDADTLLITPFYLFQDFSDFLMEMMSLMNQAKREV